MTRHVRIKLARMILVAVVVSSPVFATRAADKNIKIIDAHIHYSHDAWDMLPPPEAIAILRKAGLSKAFISSSSDQGTQMLYKEAPDLVVPVLRPYRRRGELDTWFRDTTVVGMLSELLDKNTYAGIGEFHIFGEDADLPVFRGVVKLAKKHKLFLHAHSDDDAIERIFKQDPDARVLWAHSGFADLKNIREMLNKYPNLKADLAFRNELASLGTLDADWKKLFLDFPDRFMLGTDTYTPERWFYVIDNANWNREWLKDLPENVARNIAFNNANSLANWALKK